MSEHELERDAGPSEPQSIWFFVGLILTIYGLIVTGMGLFGRPAETVLAHLRPAIWWGAIMVVFGVVFLVVGRRRGAERDLGK